MAIEIVQNATIFYVIYNDHHVAEHVATDDYMVDLFAAPKQKVTNIYTLPKQKSNFHQQKSIWRSMGLAARLGAG